MEAIRGGGQARDRRGAGPRDLSARRGAWELEAVPLHFPKRVEILDWWHAVDHLWAAAKGVFGEGTDKTETWLEARKAELWAGNVEAVIAALQAEKDKPGDKPAADEIHYFEVTTQHRSADWRRAWAGCPR